MHGELRVVVGAGGRVEQLAESPPLRVRPVRRRTHLELWLTRCAAGVLDGDTQAIRLEVGMDAHVVVRDVAATMILRGDSRTVIDATVATGGSLAWWPEPVVACDGGSHVAEASLRVDDGAHVAWREQVVPGREDEPGGTYRSTFHAVDTATGLPLLVDATVVGAPGWDGPAGTGRPGARSLTTVTVLGTRVHGPDWLQLDADGSVHRRVR